MSDLVENTGPFMVGQRLFTKDGRSHGNAIITGFKKNPYDQSIVSGKSLWSIETDFGNTSNGLSSTEILSLYYIETKDGKVSVESVDQWRKDKHNLNMENMAQATV